MDSPVIPKRSPPSLQKQGVSPPATTPPLKVVGGGTLRWEKLKQAALEDDADARKQSVVVKAKHPVKRGYVKSNTPLKKGMPKKGMPKKFFPKKKTNSAFSPPPKPVSPKIVDDEANRTLVSPIRVTEKAENTDSDEEEDDSDATPRVTSANLQADDNASVAVSIAEEEKEEKGSKEQKEQPTDVSVPEEPECISIPEEKEEEEEEPEELPLKKKMSSVEHLKRKVGRRSLSTSSLPSLAQQIAEEEQKVQEEEREASKRFSQHTRFDDRLSASVGSNPHTHSLIPLPVNNDVDTTISALRGRSTTASPAVRRSIEMESKKKGHSRSNSSVRGHSRSSSVVKGHSRSSSMLGRASLRNNSSGNEEMDLMTRILHEEKDRIEAYWSHHPQQFPSWEDACQQSFRDPPLIANVKGFPIECGDKGCTIPVVASLSFVDPDSRVPFYAQYMRLIPHLHFLFRDKQDPVIISCEARTDKERNERCFLAMCRTCHGENRFVLMGKDPSKAVKQYLQNVYPKLNLKKELTCISFPGEEYDRLSSALSSYEESNIVTTYKVGVLYWKEGQGENEAFANEMSPSFARFLDILGDRVLLKGFTGFRGGLNVTDDVTGRESLYTEYKGFQIMFHVSTLLPNNPEDVQKLERKRHLGNDIVIVIFKEGNTPFDPTSLHTQFNHTFIVVEEMEGDCYHVEVTTKPDVPRFPPLLPRPPIFQQDDKFRQFLLTKIINGERTAISKAKDFRLKLRNTRKVYLEKMVDDFKK